MPSYCFRSSDFEKFRFKDLFQSVTVWWQHWIIFLGKGTYLWCLGNVELLSENDKYCLLVWTGSTSSEQRMFRSWRTLPGEEQEKYWGNIFQQRLPETDWGAWRRDCVALRKQSCGCKYLSIFPEKGRNRIWIYRCFLELSGRIKEMNQFWNWWFSKQEKLM